MSGDVTKEEAIFDAAIQLDDPAARCAFLDNACRGNTTLRDAVEELLAFHDTKDDLLSKPAMELTRPAATVGGELLGSVLDRYRLVDRIGEGAFGEVYRAEPLDPVRRDVALKILKPGMDSRQIIARFEAERQALAMMSHPNIATVLDAGATPAGRPYFVMELVSGQPLDQFCDARRLSVPDQLRLFLAICRAVQHAHQKGLVHRDLKPSNVLVAIDDGRPVPKVIDFGIAKAVRQPASLSITGDLRSLMGTPEYMSPEQLAGGADIDTRADIYALGGMLYKLLTGVTPLGSDLLSNRSFDEICRAIREVEPQRPSDRLEGWVSDPTKSEINSVGSESQPAIAALRQTQPAALRRMLRGDLDWIVMKALEKDRSRRYETASELAADIERYLNHEPVSAGPPSAWYRASKFVRRNRIAVAAVAAVSLAIVAGGSVATIGFVRASQHAQRAEQQKQAAEIARGDAERLRGEADTRRDEAERERKQADIERARAVAESDKANRVVKVLEELLGAAHPDQGHPADFKVRQLLDEFSQTKFDTLATQPDVEATLRRTIGRAYW